MVVLQKIKKDLKLFARYIIRFFLFSVQAIKFYKVLITIDLYKAGLFFYQGVFDLAQLRFLRVKIHQKQLLVKVLAFSNHIKAVLVQNMYFKLVFGLLFSLCSKILLAGYYLVVNLLLALIMARVYLFFLL